MGKCVFPVGVAAAQANGGLVAESWRAAKVGNVMESGGLVHALVCILVSLPPLEVLYMQWEQQVRRVL